MLLYSHIGLYCKYKRLIANKKFLVYLLVMDYNGPERRSASRDTLMLMDKIQEIAIASAETATSVKLLREDWASAKKSLASCDDVVRVEGKIDKHIEKGIDSRRFSISTVVALIASGASLVGVFIAWANLEAFIKSIPKGKP